MSRDTITIITYRWKIKSIAIKRFRKNLTHKQPKISSHHKQKYLKTQNIKIYIFMLTARNRNSTSLLIKSGICKFIHRKYQVQCSR